MGGIGGLIGLSGGAAGTGFAAPTGVPLEKVANQGQADQLYGQTQDRMAQQQQLLSALQGAGGIQNQQAAFQGLQGTAGQYQQLASGQGPSPAQRQLAQNTAENVSQQGALMAGQRGASQNVGLMARQAAMQGANTQQQSAGQAATLGAQQQLAGLSGLSATQQAMGNVAGNQVANQIGQTNANVGSAQSMYGNVANTLGAYNNAQVGMQGNINSNNTALAGTMIQGQQGLLGGLWNSGGSMMSMMGGGGGGKAHGGMINMADGGMATTPQSSFGQFLTGVSAGATPGVAGATIGPNMGAAALGQAGQKKEEKPKQQQQQPMATTPADQQTVAATDNMNTASRGGLVPVMVSPGEKIVPPNKTQQAAAGGKMEAKTVPGKARVAGDDLKNDTVPMKLPPGSIVVPRTKANDDPSAFVRAVLAKKGRK